MKTKSGKREKASPVKREKAKSRLSHGYDCPHTSKGVQKGPLLLYTDRSPRAWATFKRGALLGQAQNGARVRVVEFYRSNSLASCASP